MSTRPRVNTAGKGNFQLIPLDAHRELDRLPFMADYKPPKLSPRQQAHAWQPRISMITLVRDPNERVRY